MGRYLNVGNKGFFESIRSDIYVDKTGLIEYTNNAINTKNKYICTSRPRRFGKSMIAEMLVAYYGRGYDSAELFKGFNITSKETFNEHLNQYHVIALNMQSFLSNSDDIYEFINVLEKGVLKDLAMEYKKNLTAPLSFALEEIYAETKEEFIFIIDEWDCIFREYRENTTAQRAYLNYLRDLFKDKSYIALAYMTGILPIKKYGTHSALNMFNELSMIRPGKLAHFFGFTDAEVQGLCQKYQMDYSEISSWYNGYRLGETISIYNPCSIVRAMEDGMIQNYWTQTETYEALKVYLEWEQDVLKEAIIVLLAGERISINTTKFTNDMVTFTSEDDVLTLLIHLGYLGYDVTTEEVYIPNKEIKKEFINAVSETNWDEIIKAIQVSQKLLESTWEMDQAAVAKGIEESHQETAHITYNSESALSYTVSLAYYSANQYYTIIRELPSGKGFVDLAFIPKKKYMDKPAMLIELKWNRTAETALKQMKEKRYSGALTEYYDNLLLVGIAYKKKTRKHKCLIEQY
jgi:hypothetical protein